MAAMADPTGERAAAGSMGALAAASDELETAAAESDELESD
jgi:hypothetical protein